MVEDRTNVTYLKRSGSDQTVALNSDVLVNIDLNQVFHLHNVTKQKDMFTSEMSSLGSFL